MRVTVHCPMLYRQAARDLQVRQAIWDALTLTYQNPWLLPHDVIFALLEEVKAWDNSVDRQRFTERLKQMALSENQVLNFERPTDDDAVHRAHYIASLADYHWLVDPPEATHPNRVTTDQMTTQSISLRKLCRLGMSDGDRTLPNSAHADATVEAFEQAVWQPLFKTTKWIEIYDRNISRHWAPNYQFNLKWIVELWAIYQPQGGFTIHTQERPSRIQEALIVGACDQWAEDYQLSRLTVRWDMRSDFHDRYFHTQQGWWQSHRGVDLIHQKRGIRYVWDDAELHWMRQAPRSLNETEKRS